MNEYTTRDEYKLYIKWNKGKWISSLNQTEQQNKYRKYIK